MENLIPIMSSAVAIVAILVPIVTSIISERSKIKTRKFDIHYLEKYAIIKDFYTAYGKFKSSKTYINMQALGTAVSCTMLISTEVAKPFLIKLLNELTDDFNIDTIDTLFLQCSKLLSLDTLKLN